MNTKLPLRDASNHIKDIYDALDYAFVFRSIHMETENKYKIDIRVDALFSFSIKITNLNEPVRTSHQIFSFDDHEIIVKKLNEIDEIIRANKIFISDMAGPCRAKREISLPELNKIKEEIRARAENPYGTYSKYHILDFNYVKLDYHNNITFCNEITNERKLFPLWYYIEYKAYKNMLDMINQNNQIIYGY